MFDLIILTLTVVALWNFWGVEIFGIIINMFRYDLCDIIVSGGLNAL